MRKNLWRKEAETYVQWARELENSKSRKDFVERFYSVALGFYLEAEDCEGIDVCDRKIIDLKSKMTSKELIAWDSIRHILAA